MTLVSYCPTFYLILLVLSATLSCSIHYLLVQQAMHQEDEESLHTVGDCEQVCHYLSQSAKLKEA